MGGQITYEIAYTKAAVQRKGENACIKNSGPSRMGGAARQMWGESLFSLIRSSCAYLFIYE